MDVGLNMLIAIAIYIVVLLLVAWWTNRRRPSPAMRSAAYGFSLATLGTAWTYFAGIGNATLGNWSGIANAIGPVVASTIGLPVWIRIARLAKQENAGSLSDFLAARYGKSLPLAVLATLVSMAGSLLYLALQLMLLTEVVVYFSGEPSWASGASFIMMTTLVVSAMLVGARRPNLTEYNRGFVHMIAFESVLKIIGLITAAALFIWLLGFGRFAETISLEPILNSRRFDFTFIIFAMLCTTATITLPRQFHLSFVMLERLEDIRGLWIYPLYFLVWIICIYLIAEAIRGGLFMPGVDARMQVLAIPYSNGLMLGTVVILLGGVSAGAGMAIVELTAISSMISNELVIPIMARYWNRHRVDAGQHVTNIRRIALIIFGFSAWLCYIGMGADVHPFNLAIVALTLSAHLAPALLAGIYWRRANEMGAIAGIVLGLFSWAVMVSSGPFLKVPVIDTIWPYHRDLTFSLSAFVSLTLNVLACVIVSMHARPRLIDRIQADSFVGFSRENPQLASGMRATVGDLRRLLIQFLGEEEARRTLLEYEVSMHAANLHDDALVTPTLVLTAERMLAGVIGAPSARNVMALTLAADQQDAVHISRLLDEAGLAIIFSRELLLRTLEALEEGVGVVDRELRLVAWNNNYLNLVGLSLDKVHVGKSLNALLTDDDDERPGVSPVRALLRDRMDQIADGISLQEEIPLEDGCIFRLFGTRIAAGDYLMTFADITDMRRAAMVLSRSNEELERSVRERTQQLIAVNEELEGARELAEQATNSQRRFVAAASHDLVQPLHAARLFIGTALAESGPAGNLTPLLERADIAIEGAHRLMRALLNLSKLEMGAAKPKVAPIDLGPFLESIAGEFQAQADAANLELVVLPTRYLCITDRDLLRSMLQNLVANAIRYTETGRIVIAARYAGENIRIEIRDSGVGMAPEAVARAFREFERLNDGQRMADGSGLGLSIVARIAEVLGHKVTARSLPGRGSTFSVNVPRTASPEYRARSRHKPADLKGLRVLCVDDEKDILIGTAALVTRWGGVVTTAPDAERALAMTDQWDVVIADYLLGDGMDGLDLLRHMQGECSMCILITATPNILEDEALRAQGLRVMEKPLSPAALQAALLECIRRE